jgi:hypothetical protein
MALALRADGPANGTRDFVLRSAVLVRSGASPARVAREFKLLHRALWDVLRASGRIVPADERRAADEWLDEALAAALERLDRVRMRMDLLDHSHGPAAAPEPRSGIVSERPPPLPRTRPPPLPAPEIIGPLE